MSTGKQITLTESGLKKLEEELEYLKTTGRTEVAEKIKEARGFGDLSENSEYDEAKNEQAQMESKIVQIETMLKNVKIIDEEDIDTKKVSVGCRVTLKDVKAKTETEYTIVGSTEANPFEKKLSDESPIGSALIGREKGETVSIEIPAGVIKYKIVEINK